MIASATAGRSKNRASSRAWFARATTAHIEAFIEKWRKRGVALPERNTAGFARSRSIRLAGLGLSCDLRPNRATSIFSRIPQAGHTVVAKPHFPWTKIVISSDEKRRSSRSLPGPFAAEQPTDASYLSRVVRCAPASDEAPRGPNWQSINRRTRRPKFHDERPATPRCLLALPTEASSFP